MPIVKSLLATDLYKFTMWQALLHSHPAAQAEYHFVCRNEPKIPLGELKERVEKEIDHLCSLTFAEDELDYLRGLRFIKGDFVEFLSLFRFQKKFITIYRVGNLLIIKAKGPLIHVMGFEIFMLYIVSESYTREMIDRGIVTEEYLLETGRARLREKINQLKEFEEEHYTDLHVKTLGRHPFEIFDFGLRRCALFSWHEEVVTTLANEVPQFFKGTSDVYLAKKYGLTPIGTMAHEYLQAFQGFEFRLRDFQKAALEAWVQEYRGDLGIALTDCVGMDAFLTDFDLYFAKLFDGLRHDSGDPFVWAKKAIDHYLKLKIDPHTKRLTFSDGLSVPRSIALWKELSDKIQLGFGIGTNFSNDVGIEPLQLVMKLMLCNGQPVAKIPDASGKTICVSTSFLDYMAQVFDRGTVKNSYVELPEE